MRTIYKPTGRAEEFGKFAANMYTGCGHACLYCYGPEVMRMPPARFFGRPEPRRGFLDALDKAAEKHAAGPNKDQPIFLSFTCDPFQPIEAEHGLGRQSCEILVRHGLRVAILTKAGPEMAGPALEILAADPLGGYRHWWGATLTVGSPDYAAYWEPKAALPAARVELLKEACRRGLKTWVSFEPVILADSTINMIRALSAVNLINHCAIGKLNRMQPPKPVHWPSFRTQVIGLLTDLGYRESETNLPDGMGVYAYRSFYIKKSLKGDE